MANDVDGRVKGVIVLVGCSFLITLISYAEDAVIYRKNKQEFSKVVNWLNDHAPNALNKKQAFYDAGIMNLAKLCMLTENEFQYLSEDFFLAENKNLRHDLKKLKRQMILKFWLKKSNFEEIFDKLIHAGFTSLQKLVTGLQDEQLAALVDAEKPKFLTMFEKIRSLKNHADLTHLDEYPVEEPVSLLRQIVSMLWNIAKSFAKTILFLSVIGTIIFLILCCLAYFIMLKLAAAVGQGLANLFTHLLSRRGRSQPTQVSLNPRRPLRTPPTPEAQQYSRTATGFLQRITNFFYGRRNASLPTPSLPFSPNRTSFTLNWKDKDAVVGEMQSFSVKFYTNFLMPCPCKDIRNATTEIRCGNEAIPCTVEESSPYSFLVKFTPTVAGNYQISFHANETFIKAFFKEFLPGEVDPSKTHVTTSSSTIVLKLGMPAIISLVECDRYGNRCKSSEESLTKYTFTVHEIKGDCEEINPQLNFTQICDNFVLMMKFHGTGCYRSTITYNGQPILNNEFTIIVLNDKDWEKVNSAAQNPSWNQYYETYLLPNAETSKRKKVYIYLTPKQLLVKEFYMKIFQKRRYTMRIRTTLKLSVLPSKDSETGYSMMSIKEPGHEPILFACKDRNLLIATFSQILMAKTGGTDMFEHKREHLYSELRKCYAKKSDRKQLVRIARRNLLKNSMDALKSFADSDWGKQLTVEFIGELGLDYGGLRREWFQLLSDSFFKPENHLFRKSGKDDAQSLIHPNPFRPASCKKLDLYEFAGKVVGKLLIECAFDRQQYVKARFSRAFLSQLIGLDVSWRLFESDDKELYKTKIDYILNNDPEDLDLTFTEDVYDDEQTFIKTIELKPYGNRIKVTNDNKLEYLQLVAEYRMVKSVKDEINSFTKGLNALIPENLLTIFDETELEFLICGSDEISPMDLRENFTRCIGGGFRFDTILAWFWEILFSFNQEEMARLLQFTTGSARLPPGGFSCLIPKFQINSYPGVDALPSAHTCFNMLCLPDYSSKQEFKRLLLIAINEGSEGFGLA